MNKKLVKTLKYLRWCVTLLLLIAFTIFFGGFLHHLPGAGAFAEVQFIPAIASAAAIGGTLAFVTLTVIALVSAFYGRWYCSWCCPLGLLQEVVDKLFHKIFKKASRKQQAAHWSFRVAFLAVLSVLFACGIALPLGVVDPYSLFGKISSTLWRTIIYQINNAVCDIPQNTVNDTASWNILLAISTGFFAALVIATLFRGRIFCNTLCPAGTILASISARSRRGHRLVIDQGKCVKCGKCQSVCSAGCIDIKNNQTIDFARCFVCLSCAEACPVNAIKFIARKDLLPEQKPSLSDPERRKVLISASIAGAAAFAAAKSGKKLAPSPRAIVPPGAGSTGEFLSRCTGCGLCITNCRGGCLQPASTEYGWRGFMLPVMKFSGSDPGKCEYECNNCTANCPTGALKQLSLKDKQLCRIGMAKFFPANCVAYADGEPCGACAEHCPTGALKMVKGPHEYATIPQVVKDLCIGCGNCQYACPVTPQAVRVLPVEKQSVASDPEQFRRAEEVKKAPSSIPF